MMYSARERQAITISLQRPLSSRGETPLPVGLASSVRGSAPLILEVSLPVTSLPSSDQAVRTLRRCYSCLHPCSSLLWYMSVKLSKSVTTQHTKTDTHIDSSTSRISYQTQLDKSPVPIAHQKHSTQPSATPKAQGQLTSPAVLRSG